METFSALLDTCVGHSPVNSPYKGQWSGALMFSLICAWINAWVNNREAGDWRRHRAHWNGEVDTRCLEQFQFKMGEQLFSSTIISPNLKISVAWTALQAPRHWFIIGIGNGMLRATVTDIGDNEKSKHHRHCNEVHKVCELECGCHSSGRRFDQCPDKKNTHANMQGI